MQISFYNFYCPKCGEWSEIEFDKPDIIPEGELEVTCPHCVTIWVIALNFKEITNES